MQPDTPNQTHVAEFVLLGFTEAHESRLFLFVLFLTMYLLTLVENLAIILVVAWTTASIGPCISS